MSQGTANTQPLSSGPAQPTASKSTSSLFLEQSQAVPSGAGRAPKKINLYKYLPKHAPSSVDMSKETLEKLFGDRSAGKTEQIRKPMQIKPLPRGMTQPPGLTFESHVIPSIAEKSPATSLQPASLAAPEPGVNSEDEMEGVEGPASGIIAIAPLVTESPVATVHGQHGAKDDAKALTAPDAHSTGSQVKKVYLSCMTANLRLFGLSFVRFVLGERRF